MVSQHPIFNPLFPRLHPSRCQGCTQQGCLNKYFQESTQNHDSLRQHQQKNNRINKNLKLIYSLSSTLSLLYLEIVSGIMTNSRHLHSITFISYSLISLITCISAHSSQHPEQPPSLHTQMTPSSPLPHPQPPLRSFQNPSTRLLVPCIDPCATCYSDATECSSCVNSTYWHDWRDRACYLCSSSIDHCLTCYDQMMGGLKCTQCLDNTVYLKSGNCISCSIPLQNCANCSSSSVCLSCLDDYHYLDTDDHCHLCGDYMSFCLVCTAEPSVLEFNCSECISDAYFLNASEVCVSCEQYIPLCINCTNGTYCLNCVNNSYAYNQTANECLKCYLIFQNCTECTYTQCTFCQEGYALHYGKCQCPVGWKVQGLCTTIIGCIEPQNYPDGSRGCTACNQTSTPYDNFEPLPVNNLCQCQVGELIGQYCMDEIGCISAVENLQGVPTCTFCNTIDNFQKIPNDQGHCQCIPKTEPQGTKCTDICGDGYLLPSSFTCDDGNLIEGDGCSSQCQVQTNYRCENGSSTSASQCVYIGHPITLTLEWISRSEEQNQGSFVFTVEPAISNFEKMELESLIVLQCNSTYTVSRINYDDGLLTITADYTEDMEQRFCSLVISFDRQYIISPAYTLHFQALSNDYPLIILQDQEKINSIRFSLQILSYVVLGLFLLSLPHKMIGPEMLLSCQMVYLSNCFYSKTGLFSLTIKKFHMIMGGWSFFSSSQDSALLPSFTSRVSISPFFLESTCFIVASLLGGLLFWLLLMICSSCREKKEDLFAPKLRQRLPTVYQKLIKFVYYIVIYPLVAGFLISLSLAGYINNLRLQPSSEPIFHQILNTAGQGLAWMAMGVVVTLQFTDLEKKRHQYAKLSGLQNVKKWYIPVFLIKTMLVIILFQVAITLRSFALVVYPLLVVMICYWMIILKGKPYNRTICNMSILIAQGSSIASTALSIFRNHVQLSQSFDMILIYSILFMVCLTILLSMLRVMLLYYTICRNLLFKDEIQLCKSELPEPRQSRNVDQERSGMNELEVKKRTQRGVLVEVDKEDDSRNRSNPYSIFTQERKRRERDSLEELQFRMGRRTSFIEPFENAITSILSHHQEGEGEEDNLELKAIKNRLREDLMARKGQKKGTLSLELE